MIENVVRTTVSTEKINLEYGITEFRRGPNDNLVVEVVIGQPEPSDPKSPCADITSYIARAKCRRGCSANCEGIDQSEKQHGPVPLDRTKPKVTVISSTDRCCAYLSIVGIPLPNGKEGNNDKAVSEQFWRAECVASTDEGREVLGRIDKLNELTK